MKCRGLCFNGGGKVLKAPFPYFGGKSKIADTVWDYLGDVKNYVEPFCGSLAVLLQRPTSPGIETINDADCFVANFWRSMTLDPEAVAHHADWPVSEIDLHARHSWLVNRKERLTWCLEDPDFYDAKIAGWWVWGMCAWIGSGFCSGRGPWVGNGANILDSRQLPHLGDAGQGINRQLPHLGDAGQGINRQLPHLGDAGRGILDYLLEIHNRIRNVRVCCGDWERVCGPTPTTKLGLTGVFLDPPYVTTGVDAENLYSAGISFADIPARVTQWCLARGVDPGMRIVVSAYDEYEPLLDAGWSAKKWSAGSGYASQRKTGSNGNKHRETLYVSPHCQKISTPLEDLLCAT